MIFRGIRRILHARTSLLVILNIVLFTIVLIQRRTLDSLLYRNAGVEASGRRLYRKNVEKATENVVLETHGLSSSKFSVKTNYVHGNRRGSEYVSDGLPNKDFVETQTGNRRYANKGNVNINKGNKNSDNINKDNKNSKNNVNTYTDNKKNNVNTNKDNEKNNVNTNKDNEKNNVNTNKDNENNNVNTNKDNEKNIVNTNKDNEKNNVNTNKDNEKNNVNTNKDNEKNNVNTNKDNEKNIANTNKENNKNANINKEEKNSESTNNTVCHFTQVDAFDPRIMKFIKVYPPVSCEGYNMSIVYLDNSVLRVNLTKIKANVKAENFSYCRYKPVFKNFTDDYKVFYGKWSAKFNREIRLNDEDEYLMIECYDRSGRGITRSYTTRIVWDEEKDIESYSTGYANHFKEFAPREKLNVLLVGLDGMSIQNFERTMPKTREFILRHLGAIQLEKFNKVGLNTFPNMVAMLTGREVAFLRKHWHPRHPFDRVNQYFIWSEFKKAGYRTALDLEEAAVSAFHCLQLGWQKPPVDIYTRALSVAVDGDEKMRTPDPLCKGDKPSISLHNDFLLQLSSRFNQSQTPYFAVSFLTKLTHDDLNMASAGDDLYLEFFQQLKKRNVLGNTIMLFFSDHGERYGRVRRTYNGVIESKTPMAFFILPSWFEYKYPEVSKSLRTNAKGLTSTFDLYATFKDILYFKSSSKPTNLFYGPGTSLFQKIPKSRQCQDAGISLEFCNCNSLTTPEVDAHAQQHLSTTITNTINKKFIGVQHNCAKLSPKSVRSILQLTPPTDRHKAIIKSTSVLYQLSLATAPGHGIFEAIVELNTEENKAQVLGSISRLDMYKGEKDCVKDPLLRPFCYCAS